MKTDTYTGSVSSLMEYWEERGNAKSLEKEYSIRMEGIKQIVSEASPYLHRRLALDIGCGPGIAASLFPVSTRTVGFDFSVSMLRSARNRMHYLVQGSAFNLPFCSCSFDAVTCLFVASDYSKKKGIICEAYRVLREKGFLLFSDYSLKDEHWKLRRTIRPAMGDRCNIFITNEAIMSKELEKAGFKVQRIKHVQFQAPFKLERYIKSEEEMKQLQAKNPDSWSNVQRYMQNKKIDREFILIIGAK